MAAKEKIMSWQSASEIVCGFVLADKLNPDLVNVAEVWPKYQFIITAKREGRDKTDITGMDFAAVDACDHAAVAVNGTLKTPVEYLRILHKSASQARDKVSLQKVIARMEDGEVIEPVDLLVLVDQMETNANIWKPMSDVEPQEVKFDRTGYPPLDKAVGGLPHACVTVLASTPGVGKTTLALNMVTSMIRLKENKKKKAALITLEMTMGQIHQRFIEISNLTKEEKSRVLLGRIFNIHELVAEVQKLAAVEDLCVIMIDFADLLVEKEQSEATMGEIYRNLELLATKTEVPILLISQLNRETYKAGIPRIHHIRYSGLAEATARLVLLIYNPNATVTDFMSNTAENNPLPSVEGRAYIIVAKSNFGYKEGKPGAVAVDFDGATGWGTDWHGYIGLGS